VSLASYPASTVWEDSPQALIFSDQTPPSVLLSFSPLMGQAPGYAVEGANGPLSRREREQCTRVRIIWEETTLVSPYQEGG
jgi:hypothetical protein